MQGYRRLAILLCFSAATQADIYTYTAPHGPTMITNLKPKDSVKYKILVRSQPATYSQDLKYAPTNKQKYLGLVEQAAFKHNVDPKLLHAVIQTESAYNSRAISSAGAMGLMQLMPDTATRYGVTNPYDAEQNIDAGAHYLSDLLDMFGSNLYLAIAGYNAGEGAVMKYNYTVPPYRETQNYVRQVLQLYAGG